MDADLIPTDVVFTIIRAMLSIAVLAANGITSKAEGKIRVLSIWKL